MEGPYRSPSADEILDGVTAELDDVAIMHFFEVINPKPASRVLQKSNTRPPDFADVCVRPLEVLPRVPEPECFELKARGEAVKVLNLRDWCTSEGLRRFGSTLRRWDIKSNGTTASLAARPALLAPARAAPGVLKPDLSDGSMELLDSDDEDPVSELATVPHDMAEEAAALDAALVLQDSYKGKFPVSAMHNAGVPMHMLERLEASGVLKVVVSEFEDLEYVPSWSSIRWSVSRVVGRPCAAIHFDRHVGSHRERSKVESAVALLQLGWSRAGGGMPLVPGGPLAFDKENLFKSSEYWQALMQLDSIFQERCRGGFPPQTSSLLPLLDGP